VKTFPTRASDASYETMPVAVLPFTPGGVSAVPGCSDPVT